MPPIDSRIRLTVLWLPNASYRLTNRTINMLLFSMSLMIVLITPREGAWRLRAQRDEHQTYYYVYLTCCIIWDNPLHRQHTLSTRSHQHLWLLYMAEWCVGHNSDEWFLIFYVRVTCASLAPTWLLMLALNEWPPKKRAPYVRSPISWRFGPRKRGVRPLGAPGPPEYGRSCDSSEQLTIIAYYSLL